MGFNIDFISSLVKKSTSRKRLTFKFLYISFQSTKKLYSRKIKGSLMVYVKYCLVKSQILVACAIAKTCNKKQPSLAAYIYRLKGGLWRKFLDVYVIWIGEESNVIMQNNIFWGILKLFVILLNYRPLNLIT